MIVQWIMSRSSLARRVAGKLCRFCLPHIIVLRHIEGVRLYADLNDSIESLASRVTRFDDWEPRVKKVLDAWAGPVWDVGCNIGSFSVSAVLKGHKVTAFDLSPKAAGLLSLTAIDNGLDIAVVPRPMTTHPIYYMPPGTSHSENAIELGGDDMSISYSRAEAQHGTPKILKMDIEGGEGMFLNNACFKRWIVENEIVFMLEFHHFRIGKELLWDDVPHLDLYRGKRCSHVLYYHDAEMLSEVGREFYGLSD